MAEPARVPRTVPPQGVDDVRLVAALRAGDESAFASLVDALTPAMTRLARALVPASVADEVVQDAWLGVLTGIDRFEGRSSVKTWIFRILANRAKTRAVREWRTVPFSAFALSEGAGPSVDPSRFLPAGNGWLTHHWAAPPPPWDEPAERLLSAETMGVIRDAIAALPAAQRAVITLRDVEGWSSAEVCEVLELSEGNQRLLLHRARTRVRAALDRHLRPGDAGYRRESFSASA